MSYFILYTIKLEFSWYCSREGKCCRLKVAESTKRAQWNCRTVKSLIHNLMNLFIISLGHMPCLQPQDKIKLQTFASVPNLLLPNSNISSISKFSNEK